MRFMFVVFAIVSIAACRTTTQPSSALRDDFVGPVSIDTDRYIKARAHTSVTSNSVIELYNVTTLGAEVEALPTPEDGGFEYWPYVYDKEDDTHHSPYPDRVQWGYAAGGDTARKCMKLSYAIWRHIEENKPENLAKLFETEGHPTSYFFWNNDYTQAKAEDMGYKSFWHYRRPGGLLKWISNTKMDGTCQHPTVEAIDHWAACEIKRLQGTKAAECAGHG